MDVSGQLFLDDLLALLGLDTVVFVVWGGGWIGGLMYVLYRKRTTSQAGCVGDCKAIPLMQNLAPLRAIRTRARG